MAGETSKRAWDRNLQMVSQHMARLEVSGLPRNYELFHEALSGADAALSREVAALPAAPSQAILDEIGIRHRLPGFIALAIPAGRGHEIKLLSELREKMASGVAQKQGFTRVLEAVARSLREDSDAGPRDILAEIEYLSVSLSDAVVAETELEAALKDGAERIIKAERDASAARAVTLRDRLTALPNHAALAERLEALYGGDADGRDAALFLVTISDLPELVRTYGEPAINRIIRKTATIFRKAIKKNDFLARIGRGDFAFVLKDVSRDSVHPIAERLAASLADNLVFAASDRAAATLGLSIGAALTRDAFSPQQLRLQATAALEMSKANGRPAVFIPGETA
ncbi:GGDEF domain-containing protein [Neorhizobium sp. CSC1952]|uniref:Diguanylate cyclase (GGDEF) domain-containing protein n=1 Tax=Xaviernesmea oryzae TaxID=464029 RepID=A0A1X7FF83_9HYPH|nr:MULTISPECIES: GGDEF domain-containing protein [Rhizobium/Agrobacterium group]WJR67459.1 GGDEF domain-containing protein [Rhizobium sp. CSC1952]SMF50575.1 diguanylate cyclase (GGDEF) domain-containing protein [Xaviernesmea oryzae]